ncbi:MAG: DUF5777 family beta-barrel protein, partial [Proteobacteria bacterium]|nr:DUF5777 family beta-barrel protein [Pseudomonadota bacterium]
MKKLVIALLVFLIPSSLPAFEQAMPSLKVPTNLEAQEGEFRILHRFIGPVNHQTVDTAIGMTEGAFVNLGLRYLIWSKLEANFSYQTRTREYITGLSYAYFIPQAHLRAQLDGQFFSYKDSKRKNNYFGLLSLQSEPILKRVSPVINFGYDGYNHRFGPGFGINIIIIKKFEIIGEYYPVWKKDKNPLLGSKNAFAFGLKDNTAGHHFMLLLTNSWATEPRRQML